MSKGPQFAVYGLLWMYCSVTLCRPKLELLVIDMYQALDEWANSLHYALCIGRHELLMKYRLVSHYAESGWCSESTQQKRHANKWSSYCGSEACWCNTAAGSWWTGKQARIFDPAPFIVWVECQPKSSENCLSSSVSSEWFQDSQTVGCNCIPSQICSIQDRGFDVWCIDDVVNPTCCGPSNHTCTVSCEFLVWYLSVLLCTCCTVSAIFVTYDVEVASFQPVQTGPLFKHLWVFFFSINWKIKFSYMCHGHQVS